MGEEIGDWVVENGESKKGIWKNVGAVLQSYGSWWIEKASQKVRVYNLIKLDFIIQISLLKSTFINKY